MRILGCVHYYIFQYSRYFKTDELAKSSIILYTKALPQLKLQRTNFQTNSVFDMAMKDGIALALLAMTLFVSSEAAPYTQDPTESTEIMVPPEFAPYIQDSPKNGTEPLQCTVLNIPAFIFNVHIRVCKVTPSRCGVVVVKAGNVANVDVRVCKKGPSEWRHNITN